MREIKNVLVILLLCAILLGTLPVSAISPEDTILYAGTAEELKNAIASVQGGETISLTNNIEFTGNISFSKDVTLLGNGYEIFFPTGGDGNRINIFGGATVQLGAPDGSDTLVLRGPNKQSSTGPAFIALSGASTLNMYDGVTLKDYINNNYLGGGVTIWGYSTFNMQGGTIDHCGINGGSVNLGGGVAVTQGSTFVMNGGTIKNCFAATTYDSGWQVPSGAGGGVFVGQGATFIMNRGSIINNSASSDGGGVAVIASSGSYYNNGRLFGYLDSRFEMNGGTIEGNEASYVGGGVAALGTYVTAYAIAAPNPGAGSPENPGVYISGGAIRDNTAADGGGVFLNWLRTATKIQNCTISGNSASSGGGISVMSYWTAALIDSCTISDNTATSTGGGIKLVGNTSSGGTTLKGCTITGNTTASDGAGAGVYYDSDSKLMLSGSNTVQENKRGEKLNNLNIFDADHPVYVIDSLENSKIGLSDPMLWSDDLEDADVKAASIEGMTNGYKENNPDVLPYDVFTSDHETWYPYYGLNNKQTSTSVGYPSSPKSWRGAASQYYVFKGASMMDGRAGNLYYNPTTRVYSASDSTPSGSYMVYALKDSDGACYMAYYSSGYYILKEDSTFSGSRYSEFDGMSTDSTILEGYTYRASNPSGTSTLSVYPLETITIETGADNTSEVCLVRTTYTLHYNDGTTADVTDVYLPYRQVDLGTPVRKGYAFKGWFDSETFAGAAAEKTPGVYSGTVNYYAKWELKATPVTPTVAAYQVEHYKENPDGTYSLADTDFPLYDETGKTVTAAQKTYEHYHGNSEKSVLSGEVVMPVAGTDGPVFLVLKVYYDIDTVNVSYNLDGGTGAPNVDYSDETVKYNTTITVADAPTKEGYTFAGWYLGNDIYHPGAALVVSDDMTFVAKWEEMPEPTDPDPSQPGGSQLPQTGDNSHIFLWIALLVASCAGVLGLAIYIKKKRTK